MSQQSMAHHLPLSRSIRVPDPMETKSSTDFVTSSQDLELQLFVTEKDLLIIIKYGK